MPANTRAPRTRPWAWRLASAARARPIVAGIGALGALFGAGAALKARGSALGTQLVASVTVGVLSWLVMAGSKARALERNTGSRGRRGPIFPAPVFTPPRP